MRPAVGAVPYGAAEYTSIARNMRTAKTLLSKQQEKIMANKKNCLGMPGMLVIMLSFVAAGCATIKLDDITFTPTINLEEIGSVPVNTAIGRFNFNGSVYGVSEWRFDLVAGDGDTGNSWFRIENGNRLVTAWPLEAGVYSIRVNTRGETQPVGQGVKRTFTITVAGNPAPASYALPDLAGVWEGTYTATQGETGLTLTVWEENGNYKATFHFYNLPGRTNAEEGSYYMTVTSNHSTRLYNLVGMEMFLLELFSGVVAVWEIFHFE